jgi:hypothetical protein
MRIICLRFNYIKKLQLHRKGGGGGERFPGSVERGKEIAVHYYTMRLGAVHCQLYQPVVNHNKNAGTQL